jgi:putative ABC transport system substrate-binding protein
VDRRAFISGVTFGLLAAPLVAEAQEAGKVYRIGFLSAGSQPTSENRQAFEHALRERGWVPGENLVIAYPSAEGKYDRLPALAAELVRLEPRVIVAVPTVAARAVRDATTTIPIVMLS